MNAGQRGAHLVEFTLVAGVFFLVLFGIVELARLVFTWSTLTEATRRGARVAVVCPINHSAITNVTISGADSGDGPTLPGLAPAHVQLDYLDQDGDLVANAAANPTDIFFVRVRINGYQHRFIVPYLSSVFTAPTFEAVFPSESLGAVPTDPDEAPMAAQCYGTTS